MIIHYSANLHAYFALCYLRILKSTENTANNAELTAGVTTATAVRSSASTMNRRNQQAARRNARNKDKVVLAAEKCLFALNRIFQDSPAVNALYGREASAGRISLLFADLLTLCTADLRDSIHYFLSA